MSDRHIARQQGQSIVIVAVAMVALVLFVAITVDMSEAYHRRRVAQNAADAAALAGAQELGRQLNGKSPSDLIIHRTMNDYGERNGIEDTNGFLADEINENVGGWYLDKNKNEIAEVGRVSKPPKQAIGIRARAYITASTFFGGIFGLDGLPLEAQAAVMYEVACTGAPCMLPIAIHEKTFTDEFSSTTETCFNMWDGDGAGNFGWLNWSLQTSEYSCQDDSIWTLPITDTLVTLNITDTLPDDCSANCLVINLDPDACSRIDATQYFNMDADKNIWIGGSPGIMAADNVVARLVEFIGPPPIMAKIVVYDQAKGKGCGKDDNPNGYQYHLAGFACFRITGFRLSTSNGARECDLMTDGTVHCQDCKKKKNDAGEWELVCPEPGVGYYSDPATCIDNPGQCSDIFKTECEWETGLYNRITGFVVPCIGGDYGNCKAVGNLLAPRLDE